MGYLSQFAGKVKTDNKQSGFLSQYSNYNSPENIAKRKKQKEEELKRKQEEQKRAQLQLQPSTSLPTGKSVSQQQLTNKFVSSVPQTYQAQQLQGKGQPVTTEEQRQQQEYQQKTPAIQQSVGKNLKDLAKSSILQISSFLWNAPDVAIKNVLYRDAQNLKIAKNVADVAVNPANAPVVIVKEIAKKLSGNDKKKETGILSELKDKLRTDYENWKSKSSSGQVYTGVQTELKRQQEEAGYKTSDEYNQASLKDKLTKHFGETLLTVLGGTIPSIAPYFVNARFGQAAMFVNTNQDIYDDAIKGGVDKEKATKLATTTATVISLLDSIVPDEVMGKNVKEKFISGFIKKIANLGLTSGKEAATEITQEIAQMLAEKTYREVTGKEAIDRTVMSGIGGLLGGIGFGGIDLAFNTAADVSQESKPQLETQVEVNKMPQNQDLQQQEVEQQEEAKPPETVKTEEELAREYIKGRATKLREERKYDISWTDKKGKKHKIKDVEYADAQGWVSNLDKQGISPLVTKVSETKYRLEEEPKTEEGDLISEAKKYKSAEEFVKAQGTLVYHGSKTAVSELKLEKPMSKMYKPEVYERKGIDIEPSISLSENGMIAKKFSVEGGSVIDVYVKPKKTLDLTKDSIDAEKYKAINNKIKDEYLNPDFYTLKESYKFLKENGYDSIRIKAKNELGGGNDTELRVFDPSIVKTKSQLTDIWNKANQEKYRLKDDFQKATGVDLTDSQEAKIIDLNKRIFGDDDVKITAQILTPSGQKALGSYRDGMIKILNGKADATDTYLHEAVHKYFDIFLTEDEQVNLLLSAKKEFGGKDFAEVEENLAENFINYAKNKELNNKEIKTLFDKIIFRIKRYFKNEDMITKFYNDIIEGKAKKEKKRQVQKKLNERQVQDFSDVIKKTQPQLSSKMRDEVAKYAYDLAQGTGKGVNYGYLIYDDNNRVIGRVGWSSNNDIWYQQWFKEYKRPPSLTEITQKALDDLKQGRPAEYYDKGYLDTVAGQNFTKEVKETTAKKGTLPVKGTGELKVSSLEKRIKGLKDKVDKFSEEEISDLGLGSYEVVKNEDQLKKASEFVTNNPEDAFNVITGKKEAPKDILTNAIFVAYTEYAKQQAESGNYDALIRSSSLQATRMGQEIQILSKIDPNSPFSVAKQVYDIRVKEIEEKNGQNYRKQVKKEIDSINKEAGKTKKSDWLSFIDSIKC